MIIETIGSDPEFFVLDPKGKPYPATLFASGSKENPVAIAELGRGFYEQRDNLSFEGNIPPSHNKEDFIYDMSVLRDYFSSKVVKFGYSLSSNGVEYFENRYLKTPEGMEFGCSSVISTWDSTPAHLVNRPTPTLTRAKYRVAGFHIHIGIDPASHTFTPNELAILIGRLFDLFLTIPSQRIKPEPERLVSYGKYGMIRDKPYGVECRTLSSYFTQETKLAWVWDQIKVMENFINSCNKKDLLLFTDLAYFTGNAEYYISKVFRGIFERFSDKKVLTNFNETKEIYEDKKYDTNARYTYHTAGSYTVSRF